MTTAKSHVLLCWPRTGSHGGPFVSASGKNSLWNIDMDTVLHTPLHKVADNVADMPGKQIPRKFPAWSRHVFGPILKRAEGDPIG